MILTGPEIRRRAEARDGIMIVPFDPACVGPASYDVHLGDRLFTYAPNPGQAIDPLAPPPVVEVPLGAGRRWLIQPGRLYLGVTKEYTETGDLVPMIHGRSSVGRLGLFVHVTAGVGDPGFCGHWTMELVAVQPIYIDPGMRIAQLVYHQVTGDPSPYQGRYQYQSSHPVASRFHLQGGKS